MMIREFGRLAKKVGEETLRGLEFLEGSAVHLLGLVFLPRGGVEGQETTNLEAAPEAISIGSVIVKVGPIPAELRRDPFAEASVPWSIQEAEKEHDRAREITIWKVAIGISWLITGIAALRAFGFL